MPQIINAIISYTWLFLVLLLLFAIWRNSIKTQKAQQVLNTVATKNAETAQKAVDAAYLLAQHLGKSS